MRVSTSEGELRVYRGELFLLPHRPAPPDSPVEFTVESALEKGKIPWAGGVIHLTRAQSGGIGRKTIGADPLVFQTLKGGERMKPHPNRPRKSLSKLFQETGIPPWERRRLPSLWLSGRLVWVGGIGVDAAFSCARGEEGITLAWA
jgi:tRNA(Ile)-lysidine synthase